MKRLYPVMALGALCASGNALAADPSLAAYNPAFALIFQGNAYYDNRNGEVPAMLDQHDNAFANMSGDSEGPQRGLNLDGTELEVTSNIDPYFDAWLAVTFENGKANVEEAWFRSLSLPHGLQLKAGRLLSGIGYHNEKHAHKWDFADQNLAYTALFHGEHLNGDGVQLTYLPATDNYWLIGAEVLQGSGLNGFGGELDSKATAADLGVNESQLGLSQKSGPNLFTGFVRFAPDLGSTQALQLGVSSAYHRQQQGLFSAQGGELVSQGDASLYGAQAVYKRFATGEYGKGSLNLAAEYFYASGKQQASFATQASLADANVRQTEQAGYIQATYGFAPRWKIGYRHAVAGINSRLKVAGETRDLHASNQDSLALTWQLTEFSRFRFQVSHDRLHDSSDQLQRANQVNLQYIMVMGAHGAHTF
ncbi:MAG: hypothetical protein R3292_10115 [Alcanivorax sp.]|nr:hypothetical protein [Alcanivorax sp.]